MTTPLRRDRKTDRPWYRNWALYRRTTALIFLAALVLGSYDTFSPYFRGSTSGTMILDIVPLTDPLAAIELTLATGDFHLTAMIGAAILIGAAIVLGPVFCAWVCPLGLVLDLNHSLRHHFRRLVLRKPRLERDHTPIPMLTKSVLLGLLAGFAVVAHLPVFQILSPINLLVRAIVFGSALGISVILAIITLEWFLPRIWCRSLCPLGALYGLVGRFGFLRIQINPVMAGKTPCQKCSKTCPMGVPIMEDYTMVGQTAVTHPNCTRCGECSQICPKSVLSLSFFRFPPHSSNADTNPHADDCPLGDVPLPVLKPTETA